MVGINPAQKLKIDMQKFIIKIGNAAGFVSKDAQASRMLLTSQIADAWEVESKTHLGAARIFRLIFSIKPEISVMAVEYFPQDNFTI